MYVQKYYWLFGSFLGKGIERINDKYLRRHHSPIHHIHPDRSISGTISADYRYATVENKTLSPARSMANIKSFSPISQAERYNYHTGCL